MSYQDEKKKLELISPKSLPKNTAESGLSASAIQEKFYAGLFYLHELLEEARQTTTSNKSELDEAITSIQSSIQSIQSQVQAIVVPIDTVALLESQVATLQKTLATQDASISSILSAITTINTNITKLQSDIVNGNIVSYKAIRDSSGNIITSTYATKTELSSTNSEISKIKSGDTIVEKARKDQDGNLFGTTYVKKEDCVDNLNDTSTTKPLSANQGKVLKSLIDTIQEVLASNDADLDTVQEIVSYIKSNKSLIDSITTSKVSVSDIVDNLTSSLANKPLSAKQGEVLKSLIDDLESDTTSKLALKRDIETSYDKEGAEAMVDSKIASITNVNSITDQDNEKVFDWRIKIRGEKVYLSLNDITETK